MITVYTKDGCPQCDKAKALLETKNQPFKAVKIGVDISLDDFRKDYPTVKSVPFITSETTTTRAVIGGVHELNRFLADK